MSYNMGVQYIFNMPSLLFVVFFNQTFVSGLQPLTHLVFKRILPWMKNMTLQNFFFFHHQVLKGFNCVSSHVQWFGLFSLVSGLCYLATVLHSSWLAKIHHCTIVTNRLCFNYGLTQHTCSFHSCNRRNTLRWHHTEGYFKDVLLLCSEWITLCSWLIMFFVLVYFCNYARVSLGHVLVIYCV